MTRAVAARTVVEFTLNDRVYFVVGAEGGFLAYPVCATHRRAGDGQTSLAKAHDWICPQCLCDMTGQWDRERFTTFSAEAIR